MDVLMKILQEFELFVAGMAGALISMPFQQDLKTKSAQCVFLLSGAASAHYLTPLVIEFFSVNSQSVGGVGFLLGAFGGSIVAAVTKAINSSELAEIIKHRIGGGK